MEDGGGPHMRPVINTRSRRRGSRWRPVKNARGRRWRRRSTLLAALRPWVQLLGRFKSHALAAAG